MYKAVIFDFFGVFCPDITLAWFKKTVPDFQIKLQKFQSICTESNYGRLSRADFFKELSLLANVPIIDVTTGVNAQTIINTELVHFVYKIRNSGYSIACLSNGTREWTSKVITDHNLSVLFDEIILSGDLGVVKPDPEIYLTTLKKLNVKPGESIFIDDRKENIEGAIKIGMTSLLFESTGKTIRQLSELLPIKNQKSTT